MRLRLNSDKPSQVEDKREQAEQEEYAPDELKYIAETAVECLMQMRHEYDMLEERYYKERVKNEVNEETKQKMREAMERMRAKIKAQEKIAAKPKLMKTVASLHAIRTRSEEETEKLRKWMEAEKEHLREMYAREYVHLLEY